MTGRGGEPLAGALPFWEIYPSQSQRIEIRTELPFTLERYLEGGQGERLVLIPPIINHRWILDMRPELSVIRRFCERGFEVYMVGWNSNPGQEIGFYNMISYIREVLNRIGSAAIFGYCTGGIIALLFTSCYPNRVHSLSLLATPVDFSQPDIRVLWGRCFDAGLFRRLCYNVPGEVINAIGLALLYYHLPQFSWHREFIEEMLSEEVLVDYGRRLRWMVDTPAIPGKAYEEFIQGCYKENALIKKAMRIDGHRVDLGRVDVPVLNIMAKYDHIVPIASVRALRQAVSSAHYDELVFPSTHVGLSVGKKAHQELWPRVALWIEEQGHSTICNE
ncbi:MAG: alpha/beta fold hydrolase [Gammaproteobacteria bacterium]